ncbi:hypothetical protein TrST_g399 [Triparma strigata]|uniref:Enoyl reductase (ER) domain-containing protein n=1 Tax=Triparma strigata TaxID=1606541 RepID=A0A9W7BRC8_9STRA|nr:hypothetical protein TrST_g399 [Triparma strigata]
MNAIVYHGPQKLSLSPKEIPIPLEHEVLIQVKAAALCHTDLHFQDGTLNLNSTNFTLGHEIAGTITKVGPSVSPQLIGKRVVVYYYVGCGVCEWCLKGEEQLCGSLKSEFGFISDGGLAGYLKCPSLNCVSIPDSLSFEQAAPIGCGVTTAVHASKRADMKSTDTVVVYGCNGVGYGLVQLAHNMSCPTIIAVARQEIHRSTALKYGATHVIDGTDSSTVAASIREATGGEGASIIYECVGLRETMDACVGWAGGLGKRGRLVLIGYAAGSENDFRCHPIPLVVYEQSVIGSVGATLDDLKEAVQLVADSKVRTHVDSCIGISEVLGKDGGLARIRTCRCNGKIVVNDFTS